MPAARAPARQARPKKAPDLAAAIRQLSSREGEQTGRSRCCALLICSTVWKKSCASRSLGGRGSGPEVKSRAEVAIRPVATLLAGPGPSGSHHAWGGSPSGVLSSGWAAAYSSTQAAAAGSDRRGSPPAAWQQSIGSRSQGGRLTPLAEGEPGCDSRDWGVGGRGRRRRAPP